MSPRPFSAPLLPRLGRWCLAALCLAAGGIAQATGFTVLMADELAAHTEFVHHLRETQAPGSRIELVRVVRGEAPAEEESAANVGVRTRSARATANEDTVAIAVGAEAARAAIDRPSQAPLLLAMLGRLDYEALRASPALQRTGRRVGVLLREPAMADQLVLIDVVLPQKRRLGVVATAESTPLVHELERSAQGWSLQVEYAPDARSLAAALNAVVARSDALLVLPDRIGDSQAATLAVLRAGAAAGLPVFGASEGMVRSGGLAAAVSTPAQLAQQAQALGRRLAAAGGEALIVEAAAPATVRLNATVARGLGLRVPDEQALTARVTAGK